MKNSVPLVIAIFTMACIFRYMCEISKLDVVIVMAFINALSLMFVIYFLVHYIDTYVSNEVKSFLIDVSVRDKIIKKVKNILNIITAIVLSAFGIIYMFLHNTLSNDIVAIIALGISIITTEIGESIGNIIIDKIRNKLLK